MTIESLRHVCVKHDDGDSLLVFLCVTVISSPIFFLYCAFTAAFLTQTVQLDDATVKFEIWYVQERKSLVLRWVE